MDDELKTLIRETGRVLLLERKLRLLETVLYAVLGLGVSLWALLTLRATFYRFLGV